MTNKRTLESKLHDTMSELGFERILLNNETVLHRDNKYVRLNCGERFATVELANDLYEAANNMYEDIDLYDYDHMRENGFPGDDDIVGEIRSDIIKYIISQ